MAPFLRPLLGAGLVAGGLWLGGCAGPGALPPGSSVGPAPAPATGPGVAAPPGEAGAGSLEAAADRLARGICGLPEIAHARVTPRVVLEAAVGPHRPPADLDALLGRLRPLLNTRAAGRARFLDRVMLRSLLLERELKQGGESSLATAPVAAPPRDVDFVLTADLTAARRTGGLVPCRFRLTEARTGLEVWKYECLIRRRDLEMAGDDGR